MASGPTTRSRTKKAPGHYDTAPDPRTPSPRRPQRSPSKAKTLPNPSRSQAAPYIHPDLLHSPPQSTDEAADDPDVDDQAALDQSGDDADHDDDADSTNDLPRPTPSRSRSPLKKRRQGRVDDYFPPQQDGDVDGTSQAEEELPSSASLFSAVLSFMWQLFKWVTIAVVVASAVLVPLLLLALYATSPSSLGVNEVFASLAALFSSLSLSTSPLSLSSSIQPSLPSIRDALARSHPAFKSALSAVVYPQLSTHFNPERLHPEQPLCLFIATIPSQPTSSFPHASAGRAFTSHLASLLYPPAVPSYYLDLTSHVAEPHFDGPHLERLLSSHFHGREDGLVFVGGVTEAVRKHRTGIGRVLQEWMEGRDGQSTRGVWVLEERIGEEELKRVGWDGKKGREGNWVKKAVRERMKEGGDDELVNPMLERLVRNVIVVREAAA